MAARTADVPTEVVNSAGTSIDWEDQFGFDEAGNAEFLLTVEEEG